MCKARTLDSKRCENDQATIGHTISDLRLCKIAFREDSKKAGGSQIDIRPTYKDGAGEIGASKVEGY
jgi:hypothetical protein